MNIYDSGLNARRVNLSKNFTVSGFSGENLAPLKKDTVSFSGGAKMEGEYMVYAPDYTKCKEISNNAEPATLELSKVLEEYVLPINDEAPADKPFITVTTRTKSPKSIREKVVSKFGKINEKEKAKFTELAFDDIFDYYKPKRGFSKENIIKQGNTLISYNKDFKGIPPYGNEERFLKYIIDELKKKEKIEFNANSDIDERTAIKNMARHLSSFTSNEHCADKNSYIDTYSVDGIKHYTNDIVGGRIILNDSSKNTVQKVLNGLVRASNDGKLNIISVENSVIPPSKLPKDIDYNEFEYLPSKRIKRFSDKVYAQYDRKNSPSGYMAIHINLDLSNNNLKSKKNDPFNGYKGEIQIMDANMETLKDVEDLCYKLKDKKNAFPLKYNKFKNHFNTYYKDYKVKEAFDDYTFDLYVEQRLKTLGKSTKQINENEEFASPEEMGYGGTIPEELNFNRLKEEKEKCEGKKTKKELMETHNGIMQAFQSILLEKWEKFKAICKIA